MKLQKFLKTINEAKETKTTGKDKNLSKKPEASLKKATNTIEIHVGNSNIKFHPAAGIGFGISGKGSGAGIKVVLKDVKGEVLDTIKDVSKLGSFMSDLGGDTLVKLIGKNGNVVVEQPVKAMMFGTQEPEELIGKGKSKKQKRLK